MGAARSFSDAAALLLAAGLALLAGGLLGGDLHWFPAHGTAATLGLVAALFALHAHTTARLHAAPLPVARARIAAALIAAGGLLAALGHLLQPSGLFAIVAFLGLALFAAGAAVAGLAILRAAPRQSVVREEEPLTRGDDASWKHVRMAQVFLLIGLVLMLVAYTPGASLLPWLAGTRSAGLHALLVGFGLLSVYGLGHLWVPRLSGVPAIAPGAIKGELHSTLLGLLGLLAGFLIGARWLLLAFGPFVFLGFFTYMGVLGANIMRNKSVTQRVTPEFVYVPWTFAAVFWLVTGVLMGIFLNVVPEQLSQYRVGLQWVHVHAALLGGVLQLLMGFATRLVAREAPPRFAGALKASFYALNTGLFASALGMLARDASAPAVAAGVGLVAASIALYLGAMRGFLRAPRSAARP